MQDLNWYVIRSRSNSERLVSDSLAAKGFTTFLPLYRSRRRWSDRVKDVEVALFPGYTFCKFDPQHRIPILTTPGVISIVGSPVGPVPVRESEIAAIRASLESGLLVRPWPFLADGQRVIIKHGPLEGVEGLIVRVGIKHRLVISISLLQRSVSLEIERDCVAPVNAPFPRAA